MLPELSHRSPLTKISYYSVILYLQLNKHWKSSTQNKTPQMRHQIEGQSTLKIPCTNFDVSEVHARQL